MAGKDFYAILGVLKSAPAEQVKRAYRELSKKYHPDRNPDDPTAERQFKEVQEAYQVLKDPRKRAEYDEYGDVAVGNFRTQPGGDRVYQWGDSTVDVGDLEDLFSVFGGAQSRPQPSIFEQLFKRAQKQNAPRTKPRSTPQRGADEEKPISLTFDQAVNGATVVIRLRSSRQPGKTESLEVKIPPSVDTGQKIRIKGRGHKGKNGGEMGDMLLTCAVEDHPFFTRQGADVYLEVPVTVSEAALGAKIEVPSLEDVTTVTLPAGTPSGTKLRLIGQGGPKQNGRGRGDQYIVIRIVPPKELTDEQKRLFEELAEMNPSDVREGLKT